MTADELARAYAVVRRGDMGGTSVGRSPLGTVHRDEAVPLRHDSNYLWLEEEPTLAALEAELRRLGVVAAVLPDATQGERLAAEAGAAGRWGVHRGVVMVQRRPASRAADRSRVREVDAGALAPMRRASILAQPWGSDAVADDLLRAKERIGTRVTARFFASYEGRELAASTDLYLDGADAQIEDVATVERHRRRGHGSDVVLTAIEEARAAGATFVFLVADADDWPRHWYGRLGFDEIGRYVKLSRAT